MPVRAAAIISLSLSQSLLCSGRYGDIEAGRRYHRPEDQEGESCRVPSSERRTAITLHPNPWETKARRTLCWVRPAPICATYLLTGPIYSFGAEQSTFLQYSSTWKVTPHDKTSSSSTKAPTFVSFVFRYRSPGTFSIPRSNICVP